MKKQPTGEEILAVPLKLQYYKVKTIKEYLLLLLEVLWEEQDCFDGKRPLGDSGWEYDLYIPLVKAGFVKGKVDCDGYVDDIDINAADKLIAKAIKALGQKA